MCKLKISLLCLFIPKVTTHSHLLSQYELKYVEKALKVRVAPFFLNEFDTELDFFNKVG